MQPTTYTIYYHDGSTAILMGLHYTLENVYIMARSQSASHIQLSHDLGNSPFATVNVDDGSIEFV